MISAGRCRSASSAVTRLMVPPQRSKQRTALSVAVPKIRVQGVPAGQLATPGSVENLWITDGQSRRCWSATVLCGHEEAKTMAEKSRGDHIAEVLSSEFGEL